MTPHDWDAVMKLASWEPGYAAVEREARHYLDQLPFETRTTDELVEALYPAQWARGNGILARRRIYKALKALSIRALADCCERGPERKRKHSSNMINPWLWHAATTHNSEWLGHAKRCPHCGGELTNTLTSGVN